MKRNVKMSPKSFNNNTFHLALAFLLLVDAEIRFIKKVDYFISNVVIMLLLCFIFHYLLIHFCNYIYINISYINYILI